MEGPAGIGKSTLLREIAASGAELGLRALAASCDDLEQAFPFGAARQLFEQTVVRASPDRRAALLDGPAGLTSALFGLTADQAPDIDAVAHGLFWLTANLADSEPLLLIVDDAHFCDLATMRALVYLSRRISGLPALLVLATRQTAPEEPVQAMLARIAEVATRTIEPSPLSEAATWVLVRTALGVRAEPAFVAACQAATGGNPFYLWALLAELRAEGVPAEAAHADRVSEVHPARIARSIAARLDRVSGPAREVARAFATLGEGSPVARAAEVAGLDPQAAALCADELTDAQILGESDPPAFVHPIVRTVVAEGIPARERSALHMRAARVMDVEGRSALEIAPHLLACPPAGDPWVTERLAAAAEEAVKRGAVRSAARYLERAVAEPAPDDVRGRLEIRLAQIEMRIPSPAAIDRFAAALPALADPAARAEAARDLAVALGLAGRAGEGIAVVDEAVAALAGGSPELLAALEVTALDICRLDMALRGEVPGRLDRVRTLSSAQPQLGWIVDANLALEASVVGAPAAESVELARRALAAEPPGRVRPDYEIAPYAALMVLWRADVLDEPLRHYDRLLAEARERGDLHSASLLLWYQASVALRAGNLAMAETSSRQAQELLSGWEFIYFTVMGPLVEALIERGALEEAQSVIAGSGLSADAPSAKSHLEACEVRARLRAETGDAGGALADYLAVGRLRLEEGRPNPAWSSWRSGAALAHLALGDRSEARRLADEELELARRFGAPRTLGLALRAAALVREGDLDLLREAVGVLAPSPCRLEHARALVELGAALRSSGRSDEAREPLSQGLDLAARCDASALAERARAELVATGARPRRAALTGIEALTASERRVADLAAQGLTNRQIAESLYVTVKTVESHLRNAYGKLGVAGKGELAGVLLS